VIPVCVDSLDLGSDLIDRRERVEPESTRSGFGSNVRPCGQNVGHAMDRLGQCPCDLTGSDELGFEV
jgi:hypothetical protein